MPIPTGEVVDFSRRAVLLIPATQPRNKELQLFVGVSLPKSSNVTAAGLEKLLVRYNRSLKIKHAADGRVCIILPCKKARTIKEAGERADKLLTRIVSYLGVHPVVMYCGYNTVCERLDMPQHTVNPAA
jgi:hypothetical protein